jgi:hypothetical protein
MHKSRDAKTAHKPYKYFNLLSSSPELHYFLDIAYNSIFESAN